MALRNRTPQIFPDVVVLAESVSASDSIAASVGIAYGVSETVTASDSLAVELDDVVSVSDSISVSEGTAIVDADTVNISESVSASDSISASMGISYGVSESISLNDSLVALAGDIVGTSETVTVSEGSAVVDADTVNISESISLSDSVTASISYSASISETVTVSESLGTIAGDIVGISDSSISVSEGSAVQDADSINLSESISLSESIAAIFAQVVSVSETVTVSELVISSATLTSRTRPRYAVLSNIFNLRTINRYNVGYILAKRIVSRYSLDHLELRTVTRYTVVGEYRKRIINSYSIFPGIGSDPNQPNDPPYQTAIFYGTRGVASDTPAELICGFKIKVIGGDETGLYDLTNVPYQFQLNLTESQPATWNLNIIDKFGEYNPMNPNGKWGKSIMDERPYGPGGATIILPRVRYAPNGITILPNPPNYIPMQITVDKLVKELQFSAKWGGMDWQYRGIGSAWSHTRNWENRFFSFAWKGTDYSIALNKDAQTMKDVRSNHRLTVLASAVMKEIFDRYDVKFDLRMFHDDDFIIPFLSRQNGNPQDWISQILQALIYEWTMKGGTTFTPYRPDLSGTTPNFVYEFAKMNVFDESYEGSLQSIINKVTAIRAIEGGGAVGAAIDVFLFGNQYSVEFPQPLSGVQYEIIQANNGFFSNFIYYNKKGDVIAVREATVGSVNWGLETTSSGLIIDAVRVTFTWGVAPGGFIGLGAPGRIEFHGSPGVEADVWGGAQFGVPGLGSSIDPVPDFRATSPGGNPPTSTSITKYGLRPIEIQASPLIPTKGVLQKFADRYLLKVSRQARTATYKVPLNPMIYPGTVIREIDATLSTQRDRVVTSCQHSFSGDPAARYTTYTGHDYVPQ